MTGPKSSIADQPRQPAIISLLLRIPPAEIAYFKAIVESYDNLATLRTADPHRHLLKLWYGPTHQGDIDAILEEMTRRGPVVILARDHTAA